MRKPKKSLFLHAILTALVCAQFVNCRLTEDSPKAEIYPQNGSTNVPVNTVIEVHYPKELGLTEKDMKQELFSVQECKQNTFSYLDPTRKKNPLEANAKKEGDATGTKKDENGNTVPDDSNNVGAESAQKIGNPLHFYLRTVTDSKTGRVFNYLVIDPGTENSPLKPGATYCVTAKEITNVDGVKIGEKEISFTTKKSIDFSFDNQVDITFPGNTVSPSLQEEGKFKQQDFAILYLDGSPKRPADLRSHLRLCKLLSTEDASKPQVFSSDDCNGENGTYQPSDVRLVESMESINGYTLAKYNVYAVTANIEMKAGEKYRIIVNRDMGKNQGQAAGEDNFDFDVVDQDHFGWWKAYTELVNVSGKPVAPANNSQLMFFVGTGATSSSTSPSQTVASTPASNSNQNFAATKSETAPAAGGTQVTK